MMLGIGSEDKISVADYQCGWLSVWLTISEFRHQLSSSRVLEYVLLLSLIQMKHMQINIKTIKLITNYNHAKWLRPAVFHLLT